MATATPLDAGTGVYELRSKIFRYGKQMHRTCAGFHVKFMNTITSSFSCALAQLEKRAMVGGALLFPGFLLFQKTSFQDKCRQDLSRALEKHYAAITLPTEWL